MGQPIQIFCCYAREDQPFLLELKDHLSPLVRSGLIIMQADIDVSPGEEWEEKISHYLNTAQIILLLISARFMASDYCYSKEMKRAIERHKAEEAHVIPIILRPVHWQDAPFANLQVLPEEGKPVAGRAWHTPDEAFLNVVEGVCQIIHKIAGTLVSPVNREKERAYESLCQQIEAESVTAIVVRTEDDEIGNRVVLFQEDKWDGSNIQLEYICDLARIGRHPTNIGQGESHYSEVIWLSVNERQTIPVAIFKSHKLPPSDYLIWISPNYFQRKRISIFSEKCTFIDLRWL